jgi:hypothetical protein
MVVEPPQPDPVSQRQLHRLTTLHALRTPASASPRLERLQDFGGVADYFRFGRLGAHYYTGEAQFPTVLLCQEHVRGTINGPRQEAATRIVHARSWLFRVPHGGLVAALTLDFEGPLRAAIPLLEDAYYAETRMGDELLLTSLVRCAPADISACLEDVELAGHCHQLLFAGQSAEGLVTSSGLERTLDHDLIRRLIYRYDVPYRPDSGLVRFPAEANRGMQAVAACGPYFSVFASQQDYVENAALISAIQLVGSSALLADTRQHAYSALTTLRELHAQIDETDDIQYRRVRRRLAELSERVGRLELDLSFGIEAYNEIAALVPSLRVSGLHRELFEAAALPDQAGSIAQMLDRLSRAIAAEAASVLASERGRDERRRLVWSVAVGFVSFVAIPLTLIFGFFAVATNDVSRQTSLLDIAHYKWLYATIGGIMLATLSLAIAAWLITRDRE